MDPATATELAAASTAASPFDTAFWLTALAILGLLVLSGFFSGSETALTAASRSKLKSQADKGSRGAIRAMAVTEDSERMIGALLLGNNIVNILAASLATALLTRAFGDSGVALATLVMTALVLVFGEVLPKTFAIANPEPVASRVAPIIAVLIVVFAPVVTVVRTLVRGILWSLGVRDNPEGRMLAAREEIVGAIALGHYEGAVEKDDRDRLLGALHLADRTVDEIMRHRSQIEMIDAEMPPQQVLAAVLSSPHSRLPVYRGNPDNVVGVLHQKDLLRAMYARRTEAPEGASEEDIFEAFDVTDVAKKPYFVPDTTYLDDQMKEFLRRRSHFALVVDEYGSIMGLITLEDILEEIVGEITDEFDAAAAAPLKPNEAGDFLVDGGMTIRDLNRATDWSLPDDEANTVAGLVIHEAMTIPAEGQAFNFHGFRFEVMARKENRITKLKIRRL